LFLARLQSLNEEIIDASKVDGAGWWQRLWYVIVPQLRDVTEFYVVNTVIMMIAWVFSYIYVITRGGPANSTQVLEFYIYNSAFRYNLFGSASAVAAMLFIITLVLIVPFFILRGGREEEAGGVA
jgi:ABC-type sugar transport system permease subunit